MAAKQQAYWTIEWGGGLAMGPLSTDLYHDSGQCVYEIMRNGMVACMRGEDAWDPSRIHVQAEIVARHPLTGTDALVIMDAGSGFTQGDVKRFGAVGTKVDEVNATRHGGAAQKRIGRLACFALMRELTADSTFYLFTRTSQDGPLTLVEISPRMLEERKLPTREIAPDAKELGGYRNYRGHLSIFVIPEPAIRSNDELMSELTPHLPRKPELCGTIRIGGKLFTPQPLASGVVVAPPGGELEAYLELVTQGTRGGIRLVDLATGFRVGFCPSLTVHLPYPLGRTDLGGDILLPGLLGQQDTSRGGLRGSFMGRPDRPTKTWHRIVDLLTAHVVTPARGLLEDSDVVGQSPIGRLITDDIAALLRDTYGDPDGTPPTAPGQNGIGGGGGGGGHGGGGGKGGPHGPRKPRLVPIRIGDETWWVGTTRDDPNVFAAADTDSKTIMVNAAYDVVPRAKLARMEHTLLGLFGAVAKAKSPYDVTTAQRFVTERRRETLGKQTA